jgi:1-deoxyxylulose-5-phosphate synthase
MMDYINFGSTGLKVSRICLGCMTYGSPATGKLLPGRQAWALSEAESIPFFRRALDLGINFWDTANAYSGGDSEVVVGNFLKANAKRETIVLATKVHGQMSTDPNGRGLSRKAIVGATKPHHLEDAVAALSVKLTPEEIATLEEPYIPHPVLGFS